MENRLHSLNLMAEAFRVAPGTPRIRGGFVQKDSEYRAGKYRVLDVFRVGATGQDDGSVGCDGFGQGAAGSRIVRFSFQQEVGI